jgi:protein SCO1/2
MTNHNYSKNEPKQNGDTVSVRRQSLIFQRLLSGLIGLAFVAVLSVVAWRWFVAKQAPLPVLGTVPEFSLIERSGRQIGLPDLRGHIWIADFIFTNCAGTCPVMTTAMVELQAETAKDNMNDVKLVSITVDPARDTPEVLKRFADGYGADAVQWHFLTGDSASIQQLANKGFRLSAATSGGSGDEPIIHSNRFVLVDRQARIRGYYDGTDEVAVKQLLHDIKRLYREREHS